MSKYDLDLRHFKPDSGKIRNIEIHYNGGYGRNYVAFHINTSDVTCRNKDEVKEALLRRGEEYFDDASDYDRFIAFKKDVSQTPITAHVLPKHIAKAEKEGKKAIKNTIDDVFGVGCVEVE